MEKDDEVKGVGNSYTTEFRQYDSRVCRWLSLDPIFRNFPWQSPYVAFDHKPTILNDPKGLAAGIGDDKEPAKDGGMFEEVNIVAEKPSLISRTFRKIVN